MDQASPGDNLGLYFKCVSRYFMPRSGHVRNADFFALLLPMPFGQGWVVVVVVGTLYTGTWSDGEWLPESGASRQWSGTNTSLVKEHDHDHHYQVLGSNTCIFPRKLLLVVGETGLFVSVSGFSNLRSPCSF